MKPPGFLERLGVSKHSKFSDLLKNRINLKEIPFTDRGSRLLIFRIDDRLTIRLAERWYKREAQLSAYRKRVPLVDEWAFIDEASRPLKFSIDTYPDRIEINTSAGSFTLVFVDTETLLLKLPTGHCGISFRANLDIGQVDRRGGVLRVTGDIRRNIAYTTNARILANTMEAAGPQDQRVRLLLDAPPGSALLINVTPRLGFNRYIISPEIALKNAAERWQNWFAAVPPVLEKFQSQYYFAWWVMCAGLISTRFFTTREAMTPSKQYYVGVWHWDALFHALAYRHSNPHLAQDQLRLLLDHQLENGMIPDAVHDEGVVTHLALPVDADVTKPPLLAWAAWKIYEQDHDLEFLNEIYQPIVRWNAWWFGQNDRDANGLCEYGHPFSSGLDDSPLWDEGMPVESPDLNSYLCIQLDTLANIAEAIGETADARRWKKQAGLIAKKMVETLWDEQAGLFWATHNGQPIRVRTPFNLFPLITGRMPARINRRLVKHLTNPQEFWPRFPVPTVALDDPKFNPIQMWRGPTWVNVNYLLIEGLQKAGYADIARELRRRTLDMISLQPDIYEYYHPETGANPPNAAAIFGWSSAIFIDLALAESNEENSASEK